jgi:hypothetical protein
MTTAKPGRALLQTATAVLQGGTVEKVARMILDTGSSRSWIEMQLASELGMSPSETECLSLQVLDGIGEKTVPVFRVDVVARDGSTVSLRVLGIPKICHVQEPRVLDACLDLLPLEIAPLADPPGSYAHIGLLVGGDHYWDLMLPEVKVIQGSGLVAMNSRLGWVINGVGTAPTMDSDRCFFTSPTISDELAHLGALDAMGITPEEEHPTLSSFHQSIRFQSGQYWVDLPIRHDKILESNFKQARAILRSINKKLDNLHLLQARRKAPVQAVTTRSWLTRPAGGECVE